MRLCTIINRCLIFVDARVRASRKSNHVDNDNIIIVFQQAFGDAVILQDSLSRYERMFSRETGYHVKLIAQPSVLQFMKETLPLPETFVYEEVDYKRFLREYSYYRTVTAIYDNTASTIIVPGASLSGEIFTSAIRAKRKIGLLRSVPVKKPYAMYVFPRIAFTETVKPDKEDMMLQRHRKLLHYLSDTSYQARLPRLLPKERIIEGSYAVICPGASLAEKCWPIDRFAKIADHIIEMYGLPIHLCGGADEVKYADEMKALSKHPDVITSHIGSTSFSDWSAIVQHAELVVGNDSATMHLAAAARVKSICIAGIYDKYQFFPYRVDALEPGDCLPVTICKDMPCQWCRTIGYFSGYGNAACARKIKAGQCSICIDAIAVEEVTQAIDGLMKE